MRLPAAVLSCAIVLAANTAFGQQPPVPRPFPRPGDPAASQKPPSDPLPAPPAAARPAGEPSEATLGMPIYPAAQFLVSYDAGRGQRYYLFGTNTSFAEVVAYYRSVLKQRGELVFEEPPTHMFEVGRFREETMAFPPGVTVKDYTWSGAAGYLNPRPGAQPARFRTVVQIVPQPSPPAGDVRR